MQDFTWIFCRNSNEISIWNDGEGIPVEMHPEEGLYVPSLIFGTLLTSSNYDDSEIKIIGMLNILQLKSISIKSIFLRSFSNIFHMFVLRYHSVHSL